MRKIYLRRIDDGVVVVPLAPAIMEAGDEGEQMYRFQSKPQADII